MFQGLAYKYFSLNNNVTILVFHTHKFKVGPYLVKILFPQHPLMRASSAL